MPQAPTSLAVPTVGVDELRIGSARAVIDLRSPSEFAEDRVPGAVNVPLFDDVERALVGALYRRDSPERAFREGIEIARAKVDRLVGAIGDAAGWRPPEGGLELLVARIARGGAAGMEERLAERAAELRPGAVVLHCWRGGLRSKSVVALARALGLEAAVCLRGGYKAWRARVRRELEEWRGPPSFVLRGLTGVGKTLVLRELERVRPGWTIDLEGLAGHRSSVLGAVGLAPVSQKSFESALARRIERGFPGRVVVEGESRRVGEAILPASVWSLVRDGTPLELVAPVDRRVEVLTADYLADEANRAELERALPFLEERLGRRRFGGVLVGLLRARRDRELVELLMERYYDPLYRHSDRGVDHAATFDASDSERAAREIAAWIEGRA